MNTQKEYRLSFTEEALQLVSQMTLEEKVYLMSGRTFLEDCLDAFSHPGPDTHYNDHPYPAGGNQRLGVPDLKFCDGPRGVVCGKSTCFPVTMARGATFDTDLEERVGDAIGKEVRAHGGNFFGGVCINLPQNPGWGRSQETYGEDTCHLGEMGSALVRGVQKHNVMACVKHFAFNSMENGRFNVSVEADDQTEQEVFLRHFKKCVDNGAAAIMSSYNKYRGVYCGQQKHLLREVLKERWGFDGIVVSDFIWGTQDTVNASTAGLDVEMCDTHYYGDALVQAVKEGKVPESVVDEAAVRFVRTLLSIDRAEDPQEYPVKLISCQAHVALAKEVAEKSITLIQNKNNVLPFNPEKGKKIAVFGKLANIENIGDHGSSRVFPHHIVTPLMGVTRLAPECEITFYGEQDPVRMTEIAKQADYSIVVAGCDHDDEGEFVSNDGKFTVGGDRKESLGLKKEEVEMIRTVGAACEKTAVVLIGGNMIMIDEWKDSVPAILMAYYPGMEGGTALAEILFGLVNPSGKLPFVIVKDEKDLPQIDWLADTANYDFYHGYTKLDHDGVEPSVPYGFGLSYTKYAYRDAAFAVEDGFLTGSVKVKNIGERAGEEAVQMYVGFPGSAYRRPVRSLKAFGRVCLEPGEEKTVTLRCPLDDLSCWTDDGWTLEHMTCEGYIGASSSEKDLLKGEFQV